MICLLACAGGNSTHEAPEILSAEYSRNVLAVTTSDPDSNGGMIYAEWYMWQFDGYDHWESNTYKYLQTEDIETHSFLAHKLYGYEWLVVLQAEDDNGRASNIYLLYADASEKTR